MRYHLFFPHTTPLEPDVFAVCEEVHEELRAVQEHASNVDFLTLGNGWVVARARLRHELAIDELEKRGWIVWDHITDHAAKLEDRHHVGIVPKEAGIVTGDSPLAAAKKLYEHSQRWSPLRPVMVY